MSGGVGVNIFSHFHGEGVAKAIKEFQKLQTVSAKSQFAIKKAAVPAAAALATLAVAATKALHAAMENEVSQMRFEKVMRNVTGATTSQMEAINKNIEAMAKQTGMTQEQLRPALQYLTVATGSVTTAQKDMKIAMDISAATGADLETVTAALGKAHNGVTRGLVKLDPSLKKVLGTTKDFTVIQDILIKKFGGSEAAFEKTAAGGMRRFQEGMHELWIAIGNALLPVMKDLIPYLQSFAEWAKNNASKVVFIAKAIGLVSVALIALNTYLKITAALETLVMLLNPFTAMYIALLALGAAFVWAISDMYGLKNAFNAVGNFFIGLIEFLVNTFDNWIISLVKDWNWALDKLHLGFMKIGMDWAETFGNIHIPRLGEEIKNEVLGSDRHLQVMADNAEGHTGKIIKAFNDVGGSAKKVVDKFAEFTDKLRGASDAQKKVSESAQAVSDALNKVKTATHDVETASKNILKAHHDIELAQNNVAKAYEDVEKAIQNVTNAQNDTLRSEHNLVKAHEAIEKAVQNIDKAHQGTEKSMHDVLKATEKVGDAQRKLKQTTLDATDAQKKFDQAIKGFGNTSKEGLTAQQEVDKANSNLVKSSFRIEQAKLAISQAETDLQLVLEDSTTSIEQQTEAHLNLSKAKQDLIDAGIEQKDAQIDLDQATTDYNETVNGVSTDSKTYKDLLDKLNTATENQVGAIQDLADAEYDEAGAKQAVVDAIQNEADARQAVADAQYDEAQAVIAVSDARFAEKTAAQDLADAEFNVGEAKLSVADAIDAEATAQWDYDQAKWDEAAAVRDVADARYKEASAILDLAAAQKELNKQRGLTPANIVANAQTAFDNAMRVAGVTGVPDAKTSNFASAVASGRMTQEVADMLEAKGRGFAKGAIITKPTIGLIGESGSEAIIPLSQMGNMGGNINITVNAGMGANGAEIGQQIIDEIRKSERRSGRVFAAA